MKLIQHGEDISSDSISGEKWYALGEISAGDANPRLSGMFFYV
jgi:hypothetical protein